MVGTDADGAVIVTVKTDDAALVLPAASAAVAVRALGPVEWLLAYRSTTAGVRSRRPERRCTIEHCHFAVGFRRARQQPHLIRIEIVLPVMAGAEGVLLCRRRSLKIAS